MNMAPATAPEFLVFMSVTPALELYFFVAPAPCSGFCSLSHINIFNVLMCFKLNGNELIQVLKTNKIYQTFLSNLIW